MKPFLKIYLCVGENEPKTEAVHIEIDPRLREVLQAMGGPSYKFAKKCSGALAEVLDAIPEEERFELRQELRKWLDGFEA